MNLFDYQSSKVIPSHMNVQLQSSNMWGFPDIGPELLDSSPEKMIGFRELALANELDAFHFFYFDSRFECVWNRPDQYPASLAKAGCVLTPDFSLYRDWPIAAQIWNTYRNRWVGAYWQQKHALTVVPTVSWSDERSFDFCFDGLPAKSPLAVSTVGVHFDKPGRKLFEAGYDEMCTRLQPSEVWVYGRLWFNGGVHVTEYQYLRRNIV